MSEAVIIRDDLDTRVERLLEESGRITGRQAWVNLGQPVAYPQFMRRYFTPAYARKHSALPPRGRSKKVRPLPEQRLEPVHRPRPRTPAPLVELAAAQLMESEHGSYVGHPAEGGRVRVQIQLDAVINRSEHVFLLGALRAILFPEVDR